MMISRARIVAVRPLKAAGERTAFSTAEAVRPVLSRRVWQAHAQKLPKKPKAAKVKPEEKPWPRNFKIAGGVAAAIFIPYTGVWIVTSNPTLRELLGPYLPLERLRKHFGNLEWDVQSYPDEEEDGGNIPDGYYQFPLEDSFRDRQQQSMIVNADQATLTAKIFVIGDGAQAEEQRQVAASVKANPEALANVIGGTSRMGPSTRVAVEFEDLSTDTATGESAFETDSFVLEKPDGSPPTRGLLREMHTYSTWHYTPSASPEEEKTSNAEIEKMRLEYTVEKLGKDLKDPNCTRDRDEMQAELKQAKRDLSRLRWKRRLGW